MNKILFFAGVILLCVLIISTLFFIGNLGNFAQLLGRQTTNNIGTEKSKFIGSWETNNKIDLYIFKTDGSVIKNSITGTYEIYVNNTIKLTYESFEDKNILLYNYDFSVDETILTFYEIGSLEEKIVLNKK